jgi:hypothetical protein
MMRIVFGDRFTTSSINFADDIGVRL